MDHQATLALERLELSGANRKARARSHRKGKDNATAAIQNGGLKYANPPFASSGATRLPKNGTNAMTPSYEALKVRPIGTPTQVPPRPNLLSSVIKLPGLPYPRIDKSSRSNNRAPPSAKSPFAPSRSHHVPSNPNKAPLPPRLQPTSNFPPPFAAKGHFEAPGSKKPQPPAAPVPTPAYLAQATTLPFRLATHQPLLIILDLNGTLLVRSKSKQSWVRRPHLTEFLQYCFQHHSVMVWSSAQPYNVQKMCKDIFTPQQRQALLGEWDRKTLGLSKHDYVEKVQVYKRLSRVWADESMQMKCPRYEQGARWGQWNTFLVDDGAEKAKAEPLNLAHVPEYVKPKGGKEKEEQDVLSEVVAWAEEARCWSDISAFAGAMGKSFAIGKGWNWEWEMAQVTAIEGGEGEELQTGEEVSRCEEEVLGCAEDVSESGDSDVEGGVKLSPHVLEFLKHANVRN